MSSFNHHEPCPSCKSKDNLARYDDGHGYCFGCGYWEHGDMQHKSIAIQEDTIKATAKALPDRKLRRETLEKFGVKVTSDGSIVFPFKSKGETVAYKVRASDKTFQIQRIEGKAKEPLMLFGQHLWNAGGLKVVVTEGEIDAMSVSQAQGNKWPVVSICNGAAGATKDIKNNLEFLSSFDKVVLCFDNDEPGQTAAKKCADLLPPGKAAIAILPMKDANDMIVANKEDQLLSCLWQAQVIRPDGIVAADEVDIYKAATEKLKVYDFPWPRMTTKLLGRRSGEILMATAGSGIGKSTIIREMIYDDLKDKETVGVLMLEEGIYDTLHDLMSLEINKPIRKIIAMRKINEARASQKKETLSFNIVDDLTKEEYEDAFKRIIQAGKLYLYDHFGSLESDTLLSKLRYMVCGLGCTKVYLDHISIAISGNETGNERKDIDILMTNLRSLVEETNCHLTCVSHLRKADGRAYEEGGRITLQDLRGSGALYQLSDVVLAFERNPQDSDSNRANTILVRSLKDRFGGYSGVVTALCYDYETGRIRETDIPQQEDNGSTEVIDI